MLVFGPVIAVAVAVAVCFEDRLHYRVNALARNNFRYKSSMRLTKVNFQVSLNSQDLPKEVWVVSGSWIRLLDLQTTHQCLQFGYCSRCPMPPKKVHRIEAAKKPGDFQINLHRSCYFVVAAPLNPRTCSIRKIAAAYSHLQTSRQA